jgi:hypothetical protein
MRLTSAARSPTPSRHLRLLAVRAAGCGYGDGAKGGGLVAAFGEYHGLHPVRPRPDAVLVRWGRSQKRANKVRVRAHTCACLPVVFEQCVAGGLGFVRRYDRVGSETVVVDSPWVNVPELQLLWQQLLVGEAK